MLPYFEPCYKLIVSSLTWHWLFVCGTWLLFQYMKWFITTGHVIGFFLSGALDVSCTCHISREVTQFQIIDFIYRSGSQPRWRRTPERKILLHTTSPNKVIQSSCRLNSNSNSQYQDMKVEIHGERWWFSPVEFSVVPRWSLFFSLRVQSIKAHRFFLLLTSHTCCTTHSYYWKVYCGSAVQITCLLRQVVHVGVRRGE